MTWLRIDDTFVDDPKIVMLSDAAHRALVRSWAYAAKHETDGIVPRPIIRELTRGRKIILAEILGQGLWIEQEEGAIEIKNFLRRNPSRAELEERRAKQANRTRKWRTGHREDNEM